MNFDSDEPVPIEVLAGVMVAAPREAADMMKLQLVTGMKAAEVADLRPIDFDLTSDGAFYAPAPCPGGVEHRKPHFFMRLGPRACAILHHYWLTSWHEMAPLFSLSRAEYVAEVAAACERAGVPRFHPARLRRNAAIDLADATGADNAQRATGIRLTAATGKLDGEPRSL